MIGAHPLIYRLAAGGWVCVSASRRQFHASGADQLDDVRAALAWVRHHAESYGGDPERVVAAGGSAGAGLAAAAALTGSKVAALICLYGYYGLVGLDEAAGTSQPATDVPPTFIIHGRLDTLVPAPQARAFADHLRAASDQPVVYAELPGTQHSFDVFHSVRFHAITDATVPFTEPALRQAQSSTCCACRAGARHAPGGAKWHGAKGAAMALQFRAIPRGDQFYALTTYRRNGSAVSTPIWLAPAGGYWYGYTPGRSGKARRIAHTPAVKVAISDFHGRPLDTWRSGHARLLPPSELSTARRALRTKYGMQFRVFMLVTLLGRLRRRGGRAVGLEIDLNPAP